MGIAIGMRMSSLVTLGICVMFFRSSLECSTRSLMRQVEIHLNLPDISDACESLHRQPTTRHSRFDVQKVKGAMIRKWLRSRNLDCYKYMDTFTFIASHVNCSIISNPNVQPVQFICQPDYGYFCPAFFVFGYTAWSKTRVDKSSGLGGDNCIPVNHDTSINLIGSRKESTYNVNITCYGDEPCLEHQIRFMYMRYNDTRETNPGLPICNYM